jgi:beta-glucanase (GH16 family)
MRHRHPILFAVVFATLACACESSPSAPTAPDASDEGVSFSTSAEDAGAAIPIDAALPQPSPTSVKDAASADADPAEAAPSDDGGSDSSVPGYTLTWSDEFNGPNGTPPDPSKWNYDIGGSGWGNKEREYYTSDLANSQQQGGYLVVTATPDGASSQQCWYGTCSFTSARLNTAGLFSQAYGRFETRAQMPFGQGLWPAIWMLGSNIGSVGWPACGEIDFLETIGSDITDNHGSLHAPSYNPSATYSLPNGAQYSDAFHTFAVEWDPGEVRFYVDDQLYETQDQSDMNGGTWEFNQSFFLIINVAVGGNWPGDPDSTTTFPQTMKVDWVRVYQKDGTANN